MGFLHIGQGGPEVLTSGDPPASSSQSAGIIGMSHRTQQEIILYYEDYKGQNEANYSKAEKSSL